MSIILKQPITGPAAWGGPDLEKDTRWIHPLTPEVIDGLDQAVGFGDELGRLDALPYVKDQRIYWECDGEELPPKYLPPDCR